MPYIDQATRSRLDQKIDGLATSMKVETTVFDRAGILNYVCTSLTLKIFPERKYWIMALVCGVFVTVILEYYRRWAAPYEDGKIVENGDVYPNGPTVGKDVVVNETPPMVG